VAKHLHHQHGSESAVNAGKQLALPASRQRVTLPKILHDCLRKKKAAFDSSTRYRARPSLSDHARRLVRLRPNGDSFVVQPPQRWCLIKRCLVSSISTFHHNFRFPHGRLKSSVCIRLFYLSIPDCITVRCGNCLSLQSYAHV
jgi:hypothetical protein